MANVWEIDDWEKNGNIKNLKLIRAQSRLKNAWWIVLAPYSLKMWMMEHLRNVIAEQGFCFQKEKHG